MLLEIVNCVPVFVYVYAGSAAVLVSGGGGRGGHGSPSRHRQAWDPPQDPERHPAAKTAQDPRKYTFPKIAATHFTSLVPRTLRGTVKALAGLWRFDGRWRTATNPFMNCAELTFFWKIFFKKTASSKLRWTPFWTAPNPFINSAKLYIYILKKLKIKLCKVNCAGALYKPHWNILFEIFFTKTRQENCAEPL